MKVLDIDMDFFLADCCPLAPPGERPHAAGHEPWSESEVYAFLEDNCGLKTESPLRGSLFETHDEALVYWLSLMERGELDSPFELVHIDAHSDLGIGQPGTGFVLNKVISLAPAKRRDARRYYECEQLDEANYLLFALAFRMISSLTLVRNPRSRFDIPPEIAIVDEENEYSGIHLRSALSALFEAVNGAEPVVPFKVYDDHRQFKDAGFDFVSMARSPRYAPAEADFIMDIMQRYILR